MRLQNFKPKGFDEAPQMKHKGYFFPNPDGETTREMKATTRGKYN